MAGKVCTWTNVLALTASFSALVAPLAGAAQSTPATFKVAFLNIQSGKGEPALAGHLVQFSDTTNCTDTTQPLNAWGIGFIQEHLRNSIAADSSVVALGLGEAWASVCGSPENVRKALGWAARSSERNGVAMVARYGFAGPEEWQQLDTSLNPNTADTMWVLRVPVCLDATCATSMNLYSAHWYASGTSAATTYDRQGQQTADFLQRTSGANPHVLVGDLNVWEGVPTCSQQPVNAGLSYLRNAGYVDAWPAIHGTAEGFSGMVNRAGCGVPEGYAWKRIDYAWSPGSLPPIAIERWGVVTPGDGAPSDHYGIVATYAWPGTTAAPDTIAPTVSVASPVNGSTISGTVTISVSATDNIAVTRVEVMEDGVVAATLTSPPYQTTWDTTAAASGTHTISARAYDAAKNVGASSTAQVFVQQPASAPTGTAQWVNLVNAVASGSSVQKTGGCGTCADAGGTSSAAITSGDGYAEFAPGAGGRLYAGLGANTTANTDPAQIDFAFSFWPDGGWDIRERNVYRTEGRFAAGDVFRVAVQNGAVKYYQNGALVYTSAAPAVWPLVLDATLISTGATVGNASVSSASTPVTPPAPVSILTTSLPAAIAGQQYSAAVQASGGSGTYSWSVVSGTLPAGLALGASTGVISGVPAAAGTSAFTIRATDSGNATSFADAPLSITVAAASAAVVVDTTSMPPGRLADPYSAALHASGGSGTFTWSVAAGALPPGLAIDSAIGTITGTPAKSGRFRFTARATDAADSTRSGDQPLEIAVLAAAAASTYDAISDRTVRTKGTPVALGAAGFTFTEPDFGTRVLRVTDGNTRPGLINRSFRTPSGSHTNAWSADGRYFYVVSTDGTLLGYAFDASTMTATRLNASPTGDGGLTLRFFNEPTFSYVMPGVAYGTYSGTGANLHTIDQYDFESNQYTQMIDLESVAGTLAGTYVGGLDASAGATERIIAFFGGTGQDQHFYLILFDRNNPANRHLVDTVASTVDGKATDTLLNFKIHAAAIDRSGRYVTIYPTGADLQAPRSAAPAYIWDTAANTFTATPLAAARAGGHDAYGFGYRVNQDCCTSSTWDAAQWQFRALATPLATADLVAPVLSPQEVYLGDHPSWHNAQADRLVPFIDATYRYGNNTTQWRAWDDEIIGVQTDAAGSGATVWRFAHHHTVVANDGDPTAMYFWYTPRANVSPDGRWALFTSNWEKTLGTDPGGEIGGTYRQDTFLVELKSNGAVTPPPPGPAPVSIVTTSLPDASRGLYYSAGLQATGGTSPFTWSIASGQLPPGLQLDAASGVISGTPSRQGTWSFTVKAADSAAQASSATQNLSLRVRKR